MATFTVTSLSDVTDATDGVLTLREAAALANTTAGADVIDFDSGVGGAIENGGLIRLVQSTIGLSDQVTIDGGNLITITGDVNGDDVLVAGTNNTDIDASLGNAAAISDGIDNDQDGLTDAADSNGETLLDDNIRIFNVSSLAGSAAFSNIALTGGRTQGSYQDGGAILSNATLVLNNVEFVGNSTGGEFSDGGAVYSSSDLRIYDSAFSGGRTNGREADAGAVYARGAATIDGSSFSDNVSRGTYADGGAVYFFDEASVSDSSFVGNVAFNTRGGAIFSRGGLQLDNSYIADNISASGGGIALRAVAEISNTTITDNMSSGGGGIFTQSTLYLTGGTVSDNASGNHGGGVATYSNLHIDGTVFSGNTAVANGGAIQGNYGLNISIRNAVLDGNQAGYGRPNITFAGYGGGVHGRYANIYDSVISNNSGVGSGAGVKVSNVKLIGSSVVGNTLDRGGNPAYSGDFFSGGGGVKAYQGTVVSSTIALNTTVGDNASGAGLNINNLTLENSTIYGNTTDGRFSYGAGVTSRYAVVTSSTISGNRTLDAESSVGGLLATTSFGSASLAITNSIVLGNANVEPGPAGTADLLVTGFEQFGNPADFPPTYAGTNIIGTSIVASDGTTIGTTSAADVFEQVVTLSGVSAGVLADNGGSVSTIALLAGGNAVDAGDATLLPVDLEDVDLDGDVTDLIGVDGRGFIRVVDAGLDLGAFEAQPEPITGTDNDDVLNGTTGPDVVLGLGGNDTLNGGSGADVMDGGLGNDRFFVDDAGDVVVEAAGEGTDLVSTSIDFTLPEHVENGSTLGTGDVAITGNGLANFITGNGGANLLRGLDGGDRLIAGLGDDTLEGGSGNDILQGQGGADRFVVTADNGDDQILDWEATTDVLDFSTLGLRFVDLAIISSGNEALITFDDPAGGSGSIRLAGIDPEALEIGIMADPGGVGSPGGIPLTAGTSGADNLAATNGDDDVVGLAGNDILNGRAGADTMVGGFGNDRYFLDNAGDLAIEQQFQGTDQMDATFSFTLAEHIENGAVLGGGAVDITGNGLANFITGSALSNVLTGLDGRDRLIGFDGDDTLIGGLENDVLEGGAGADVFVFAPEDGLNLITDFEVGVDLIDVTALNVSFADLTIVDGLLGARVIFDLTPGSVDLVTVQGVAAADLRLTSFLGAPNDPIVGTEGNDVLFGTIENDELQGLGGADLVDGRAGADTMLGGLGDDRYFVDDAGDVVTELPGEGTDLVSSFIDFTLPEHVENGSALGTDDVDLTGNGLANALTGNAGANTLSGEDGSDNLQGLAGADLIDGGAGTDVLRGGADADTFLFETGDGTDQIIDFEIDVDTINLSATGLAFGDLSITDTGPNATINYESDTITVFNTTAAQLDQNQFEFGP